MQIAQGSLVVDLDHKGGGNMLIFKSHTPSESIVIERADIDDLIELMERVKALRQKGARRVPQVHQRNQEAQGGQVEAQDR